MNGNIHWNFQEFVNGHVHCLVHWFFFRSSHGKSHDQISANMDRHSKIFLSKIKNKKGHEETIVKVCAKFFQARQQIKMHTGLRWPLGPMRIFQVNVKENIVRWPIWQSAFRRLVLDVKPYCEIHASVAKPGGLLGDGVRWNVTWNAHIFFLKQIFTSALVPACA